MFVPHGLRLMDNIHCFDCANGGSEAFSGIRPQVSARNHPKRATFTCKFKRVGYVRRMLDTGLFSFQIIMAGQPNPP